MKKLILGVLAFVGLAIAGMAIVPMPDTYITGKEVQEIKAEASPSPSPSFSPLDTQVHILPIEEPKANALDIIELGAKNSLVLRGPIMEESVAKIQEKIIRMSNALSKNATIYLVIDSPGGSVMDGMQLIDTIKGLPQRVKTISIFSASMAFQVVQNLDERMVTPSGTLMSHQAAIQGIGGQFSSDGKGQLFSRLNWILDALKVLDHQAASRMQMSDSAYLDLIHDEYWVSGTKALKDKAADRVVLLRCSQELMEGRDVVTLNTMFGAIRIAYSKCPVISAPLEISMGMTAKNNKELKKLVEELTLDKRAFVRDYIVTDKFKDLIK